MAGPRIRAPSNGADHQRRDDPAVQGPAGEASNGDRDPELVHLPAYAPNLNLIDRIWWLFKKETVYNEYFPTFADLRAAVDGFFARLDDYRDEIQSLITDKFHVIGKLNPQAP